MTIYDGTNMEGDWTLTITDHVSIDSGTLQQWCVTISWE
ncbi:MAG: proprotein convertase P-domain-containing protein [Enhygromyxa sp.]